MKPEDLHNKGILISCLNWGMGHVSRCIGLIQQLHYQKNKIVIAGSKEQIKVFKQYFSEIHFIDFQGYPFQFSETKSFSKSIKESTIQLYKFYKKEQIFVDKLIREHGIDITISDHRYGFRSSSCHSIFLTHQLNLPLKGFSAFFTFIHRHWIGKFNEIWVLDNIQSELAGKLSETKPSKRIHYIGWYSRFMNTEPTVNQTQSTNQAILLLSGPEIHLQFLHDWFEKHCPRGRKKIIIGSKSALSKIEISDNSIQMIEAKEWKKIDQILIHADEIYSFFGYSTLMDVQYLKAQFKLIPCPNQWEQEYLSQIHPKYLITKNEFFDFI